MSSSLEEPRPPVTAWLAEFAATLEKDAGPFARIIAQKLAESWKQSVVVDNRTGSGGNIGADLVAKAPADGYTMLNISLAHAINATLYQKLPYSVLKDFAPGHSGWLFAAAAVRVSRCAGKEREGADRLRKNAQPQLRFRRRGRDQPPHRRAVQACHWPRHDARAVQGRALAANDLMGGQIQLMFNAMPELIQFVKAGRLHALAVTSRDRYPLVPELPTMIESGFPGFEAGNWIGVVVPAGTPKPIVNKLSGEVVRIIKTPEVKDKFSAQGIDAIGLAPDQFSKFLRDEANKWGKVVKEVGARAD